MSARANYYKIGLFAISAVILAVIAVIVLGAGVLFRNESLVETYMEQSVQGLDVGSPFKFRGVQIGNVKEINLVGNEYDTNRPYIIVRASILPKALKVDIQEAIDANLQREIERGLRVRLASQGLTGTAFLEADYLEPARYPPLDFEWEPLYPYLPSAPSTITQLSESVDRILRSLERINVQGITEAIEKSLRVTTKTIEGFNVQGITGQAEKLLVEFRATNKRFHQILDDIQLGPIISDASATMAAAKRITESAKKPMDRFLAPLPETSKRFHDLSKNLTVFSGDLQETLTQLRRILRRMDNLVSSQQQDIDRTIENLRLISENLKELTEDAKRYPSKVIFGGPPTPSERIDR